jgi:hypothetical protein
MNDGIVKTEATDSGATFSECMKYRYKLWRVWNTKSPLLYFILMNPSTADEIKNDPTIERQCRRARSLGFGGLVILNCGAIRETNSETAWSDDDPVGPDNLAHIEAEVTSNPTAIFVAGWGKPAKSYGADVDILSLFSRLSVPLWCLGVNKDGSPKHPLYVSYNEKLRIYAYNL